MTGFPSAPDVLTLAQAGTRPTVNSAAPDVQKTAQEFEAVFLAQMIAHMFTDISNGGLFGSGKQSEAYQTMLHQEMGSAISKAGGVGIADALVRQILAYQEAETS